MLSGPWRFSRSEANPSAITTGQPPIFFYLFINLTSYICIVKGPPSGRLFFYGKRAGLGHSRRESKAECTGVEAFFRTRPNGKKAATV
jgi:hypothetical protein